MNYFIIGNTVPLRMTMYLLSLTQSGDNYSLSRRLNLNYKKGILRNKMIRIFLRALYRIIRLPLEIFEIVISDIVIYLYPADQMSHFYFRISILLNKTVYTDFYISKYDTMVLDRKIVFDESSLAKKYYSHDFDVIKKSKQIAFMSKLEGPRFFKMFSVERDSYAVVPVVKFDMGIAKINFFKGENHTLNICWWGTYIPLHGLEIILESILILKEKDINFKFYIFGDSEEKSKKYKDYILLNELTELVSINNEYSFNNNKLEPFLLENCDLALGAFGTSDKAKTVIVNKLIEASAMRIPVLNMESEVVDERYNDECIFFSKNDAKSISRKIVEIYSTPYKTIEEMTTKSYEVFCRNSAITSFVEITENYFKKMKAELNSFNPKK